MMRSWKITRFGLFLIWFSSSLTCCFLFPLPLAPTRTHANIAPVPSNSLKPKQLCAVNGDFDEDRQGESTKKCPDTKRIFLISDATGATSRSMLLKSLAQFDTSATEKAPYEAQDDDEDYPSTEECSDVRTRTYTFVRTPRALTKILKKAKERDACVMYTIANTELRELAGKECRELNLVHVDLIGPSLNALGEFLGKEPLGFSGERAILSGLGDSYYQRIDAVEFCLKADDGQAPWLLPEADIVLVGVSRSGKTPLSVVLSQTMSLKVANIPLVLDIAPPIELLEQVDPKRVFCLTISPSELRKIRTNRLERRGVRDLEKKLEGKNIIIPKSNYADRNYILKDLSSVRQLCEEHNWTEIDVTGRAIEETATCIMKMFNENFLDEENGGFSNQHIG